MNNSNIQIYCDGGRKTGYGHVSRSKALLKFFISRGLNSSIFGLSKEANSLIGDEYHEDKDAEIIIFDSHRDLDLLIIEKRKANKIIITLDWFGKEKPDYNIIVYPHIKPKSRVQNFIGFEYIIIRDEILFLKGTKKIKSRALVCIGGGDLLEQGHRAAQILHQRGLDVILIIGPIFTGQLKNKNYKVLISPNNFPELLASSSLVVTNGGGCMFESIFLEIPTYALPQSVFESNIAQSALKDGSLLGIGLESIKQFNIAVASRYKFPKTNLVDGKGVKRIYDRIKSI